MEVRAIQRIAFGCSNWQVSFKPFISICDDITTIQRKIEAGYDINNHIAISKEKRSLLDLSIDYQYLDIEKLLRENGAKKAADLAL